MFEKYKRMPVEEEAKVAEQLKALAQQDDNMPLPGSLRSSALLEKLQEQPSLVSLEGGLFTKKRTMYVVSTCAAAFLMVIGLVKFYPLMSSGNTMAAAPVASSAAAAAVYDSDGGAEYQQIMRALEILSNTVLTEEEAVAKSAEEAPAALELKSTVTAGSQNLEEPAAPVGNTEEEEIPVETEEAVEEEEAVEVEAEEEFDASGDIMLTAAPATAYGAVGNLVSTSGEWVFWLEQKDSTTLHLINSETMEEEASISLPEASMVSELAAYSNMLVCIDPNNFTSEEGIPGITVYLYQLGEDKTASLLNTIAVSGTFDQSYLTSDGILFLASNQLLDMEAVAQNSSADFSEILPKVFNDQYQDEAAPLPVENIAVIETPVQPNYLNVTAIDLANGGAACTWSFLGREGTITISDHIMQMITPDGEGGTQLISIDFSGNTVQYRISNSIPEQ